MLEAELAYPVMAWLASRGMTPFGEVPWHTRATDVVGVSDAAIEAVELKTSLSRKVILQAHLNQLFAIRSWCAVPTRPRNFQERLRCGVGLLAVSNGRVDVLHEPTENPQLINARWVQMIRETCKRLEPFGEAGMPTMRGIGPAQAVYDAVLSYRARNPVASWHELFAAVPNHYKHAASMRSAMAVVAGVREKRRQRPCGNSK